MREIPEDELPDFGIRGLTGWKMDARNLGASDIRFLREAAAGRATFSAQRPKHARNAALAENGGLVTVEHHSTYEKEFAVCDPATNKLVTRKRNVHVFEAKLTPSGRAALAAASPFKKKR